MISAWQFNTGFGTRLVFSEYLLDELLNGMVGGTKGCQSGSFGVVTVLLLVSCGGTGLIPSDL